MKCQKCDRPATFHITELAGGTPQEIHLCEEHAHTYLKQPEENEDAAASLTEMLAEKLEGVGQTAEELARLDQQACPICGITFYEFRNQGRLGCPHDYVCFEQQLEPLILNIHGETQHKGKRPKCSTTDSDQQTKLIRLRREMREAISEENYERASDLRDEIKSIEEETSH